MSQDTKHLWIRLALTKAIVNVNNCVGIGLRKFVFINCGIEPENICIFCASVPSSFRNAKCWCRMVSVWLELRSIDSQRSLNSLRSTFRRWDARRATGDTRLIAALQPDLPLSTWKRSDLSYVSETSDIPSSVDKALPDWTHHTSFSKMIH